MYIEPLKLEFWIYRLCKTEMVEDWSNVGEPGKPTPAIRVVNEVLVDDPSDNICIGGHGKDGKYYQFDSYEAYNSFEYFRRDFDKHGLWVESQKVSVDRSALKIIEK